MKKQKENFSIEILKKSEIFVKDEMEILKGGTNETGCNTKCSCNGGSKNCFLHCKKFELKLPFPWKF